MPRLYLVRHGRAAAGFGEDADPDLDETGRAEAEAMADGLAPLGPLPLITSPLRRTRTTAAALERRWGTSAIVEPAVAEVPSPSEDLEARAAWLHDALRSTWPALGPRYESWRTMVVAFLFGLRVDTVIVTHFVAINAAIGAATADERVVCAHLANGSVTALDHDGSTLTLVGAGAQTDPGRGTVL